MQFLDTCFKSAVVLMATAAAVLLMGGSAQAATSVKCSSADLRSEFPAVYNLKAVNLPKKTYGYAPPCLVAQGGAGAVQYFWSQHGHAPRSLEIQGARWTAGQWRVSYRLVTSEDSSIGKFTLTHGKQRITFDGAS